MGQNALNVRRLATTGRVDTLLGMPKAIPPDARTLRIPHVGEVAVFRDGQTWLAMYTDFADPQLSPTGSGPTPLEAVASLLMDQEL